MYLIYQTKEPMIPNFSLVIAAVTERDVSKPSWKKSKTLMRTLGERCLIQAIITAPASIETGIHSY